jgi:hypothetical protein
MGLILQFWWKPTPWGPNMADDGLTAFVNMDVLDSDFLLSLTSVSIQ